MAKYLVAKALSVSVVADLRLQRYSAANHIIKTPFTLGVVWYGVVAPHQRRTAVICACKMGQCLHQHIDSWQHDDTLRNAFVNDHLLKITTGAMCCASLEITANV